MNPLKSLPWRYRFRAIPPTEESIISGKEVLDLPLVGVQEVRNPAFFISLAPGVTSRGTAYGTSSGGGRQLNTTVNGSLSGSIEWHLDGAVIGQGYMASGSFNSSRFHRTWSGSTR